MFIAIIMGSASDKDKMQLAEDALTEFGISYEKKILSAHRSPELVREYVKSASERGAQAFICGAGMAAHLAGCVAGLTYLPVIGIPLSGSALGGKDSLYATVQMPKGVPVATVAIDGAYNAGILAVQMMALSNPDLASKLKDFRKKMTDAIIDLNK
jgi:5-(carboxyamino)imidazole ribonucleotide mutase